MRNCLLAISIALAAGNPTSAFAADARELVRLPAPMREHLLANMRDHLAALGEIQAALGQSQLEQAAEIAERRLGMSSLAAHGAEHMAPLMPASMREIGTAMHRAASRFARTAEEAQVQGDVRPALQALAAITKQCVACHAAYRLP